MIFRKEKADSGQIFQRCELEYKNLAEYSAMYTSSGDWVIDLGHRDTCLVNIHRRQDSDLVQKDPRRLVYVNQPEKKGLRFKLLQLIDNADKTVSKLSKSKVDFIVSKLQNGYDKMFCDKDTNYVPEIHVIIPVWSNNGTAQVVTLIGRINLVFV